MDRGRSASNHSTTLSRNETRVKCVPPLLPTKCPPRLKGSTTDSRYVFHIAARRSTHPSPNRADLVQRKSHGRGGTVQRRFAQNLDTKNSTTQAAIGSEETESYGRGALPVPNVSDFSRAVLPSCRVAIVAVLVHARRERALL